VNYGYDGSDIVFRTGEGSKLAAACGHTVVAFEVDDFGERHGTGGACLLPG
jgi:hypothetical protein